MGLDPHDIKATQEIIKKINADIQVLCERLNMPIIEHPQT